MYAGSWDNNQKNGNGTMIFADKSQFTGWWTNDLRILGVQINEDFS